ncbi:ABC transporter substrate-binding protein [Cohnella lubricantis]|uniref:ABC transporter substrate-binding protein n=1 Tax=Cohnella lubricantis TaxID=2163172 RepID=A0A841TET4_9BACL|nr:ABC transporter substrate-binding protein [Cohnella lubricantis]MBB6678585.1 ABC transporter substrate-binding protein [Cohnella lubricantis]MBP2119105.1 peptide/nickel transport system substrate-binding protein [Cohnella lubricantis]
MRKGLYGLLMLALVSLAITACSGNSNNTNSTSSAPDSASPSASAASGEPKDGGNLIFGVQADPQILNPIYAGDRVSLTIDQALYAPLFQVNNGQKTFYLADSLDVSEDNLTYTLKLKSGLTWHDGQPLTADDVVFTFDKILDENQNSYFRENLIIGGKPVEVAKIDDTTVEFKLPQVSPAFEATLVQLTPIPKHIFENEADIQKSTKNNTPVGSGPFKFKEYKTGEYVTLERFDNYFGGKPHLDSITYRIAKDANTTNLALQNGEINVAYVDPADVNTIESTGKFDIQAYSEGRLGYLLFNEDSDTGALAKKEVRQAISYALNRDEMIQAVYGSSDYADPAKSFVTPDGLFFTNDVPTYDNDPEKAKELLASAGVSNLKLRFIVSSGNKAQEAASLYIQQKLKAVGIDVELQNMDSTAYGQKFSDVTAKDYELAFGGYIMGYDPDAYSILYKSGAGANYTRYKNEKVDQLFVQGGSEGDPAKRGEIYQELQKTIAEDAVIYPVAYTKTIVAIDNQFGGLEDAVLKPVVIFENPAKLYLK